MPVRIGQVTAAGQRLYHRLNGTAAPVSPAPSHDLRVSDYLIAQRPRPAGPSPAQGDDAALALALPGLLAGMDLRLPNMQSAGLARQGAGQLHEIAEQVNDLLRRDVGRLEGVLHRGLRFARQPTSEILAVAQSLAAEVAPETTETVERILTQIPILGAVVSLYSAVQTTLEFVDHRKEETEIGSARQKTRSVVVGYGFGSLERYRRTQGRRLTVQVGRAWAETGLQIGGALVPGGGTAIVGVAGAAGLVGSLISTGIRVLRQYNEVLAAKGALQRLQAGPLSLADMDATLRGNPILAAYLLHVSGVGPMELLGAAVPEARPVPLIRLLPGDVGAHAKGPVDGGNLADWDDKTCQASRFQVRDVHSTEWTVIWDDDVGILRLVFDQTDALIEDCLWALYLGRPAGGGSVQWHRVYDPRARRAKNSRRRAALKEAVQRVWAHDAGRPVPVTEFIPVAPGSAPPQPGPRR